jgi:hypothetical protein
MLGSDKWRPFVAIFVNSGNFTIAAVHAVRLPDLDEWRLSGSLARGLNDHKWSQAAECASREKRQVFEEEDSEPVSLRMASSSHLPTVRRLNRPGFSGGCFV